MQFLLIHYEIKITPNTCVYASICCVLAMSHLILFHASIRCVLAMPHLILFQTCYYTFILKDIFATLKYTTFQIKNKNVKKQTEIHYENIFRFATQNWKKIFCVFNVCREE